MPLAALKLNIGSKFSEVYIRCNEPMPLAALKQWIMDILKNKLKLLQRTYAACGIETLHTRPSLGNRYHRCNEPMPLAALKLPEYDDDDESVPELQRTYAACGIETGFPLPLSTPMLGVATNLCRLRH